MVGGRSREQHAADAAPARSAGRQPLLARPQHHQGAGVHPDAASVVRKQRWPGIGWQPKALSHRTGIDAQGITARALRAAPVKTRKRGGGAGTARSAVQCSSQLVVWQDSHVNALEAATTPAPACQPLLPPAFVDCRWPIRRPATPCGISASQSWCSTAAPARAEIACRRPPR